MGSNNLVALMQLVVINTFVADIERQYKFIKYLGDLRPVTTKCQLPKVTLSSIFDRCSLLELDPILGLIIHTHTPLSKEYSIVQCSVQSGNTKGVMFKSCYLGLKENDLLFEINLKRFEGCCWLALHRIYILQCKSE